jgi:PleD family two-component response regulator
MESLDLSQQKTRDALSSSADDARFKEQALANGWLKTMAADALWHLSNGDASLEELLPLLELLPIPDQPAAHQPVLDQGGSEPAQAPETPALKPRRILIVDDTEANRVLIRSTFRNEGYELSEAATGEDALKEIERLRPDLVLLDLMMPGMDGFAVVKRLRTELGIADLPILVLTAVSEAESQSMALEMGADDYLIKPFHPKVLRARVKALFRRSEYTGNGAQAPAGPA